MSWKPEVKVNGTWSRNGLVFATREEAEASARNLMGRWVLVEAARAAEVDLPVNATFVDGGLKMKQALT